jgi:hemoglobin-like flavoprotein
MLNAPLLRASFELVVERSPLVVRRFYEIFFERYPQVRPMFRSTPEGLLRQEKMLTDALVAVIDHVEDASWLRTTLLSLGAKHEGYGVTDAMYGWVGECLLAALQEAAGDAWSPAIAQAWTEAFGAIAGLMCEGAKNAREEAMPTSRRAPPVMPPASVPRSA